MSITIEYTDGTKDMFSSPGKYLSASTSDDDDTWIKITENKRDTNDDEYDSDEDVLIAEISKECIRSIRYK